MKAFIFMVLSAVVGLVVSNPPMATMDSAIEMAMFDQELFVNQTCRKFQLLYDMFACDCVIIAMDTAPTPSPCDQGQRGCCPYIVRPGPKGSVIQPFSGYRGNAAIIVDWGSPYNRDCDWRRNCTVSDTGFLYV